MKDIKKYQGVIPAFYACYDAEGNISTEGVKALTRHLIAKGVKGVYVGGSSGECIYQHVDERKAVLEAVMSEAKGKLTVIAHVGCNNTADSVELARHAESVGVDAIASIPPIYFHLPEYAIAKYWNDMSAAAPNTEFVIYNIPQLAGTGLTMSLLGEMLKNPVLVKNMKAAIDAGKAIHLMGLVGTGGVHSHADHWFGVLEMAKHLGAKDVYLHCITDGRDTDPHSGKGFLADLQAKLDELGIGKIASVSGRYYAMDRDNNWDREEKAYAAFVYGEGNHAANAAEAIEASYAADKTDEFVLPCVTCEGGRVQDGDTVIFMNFRPDRARQMTRIFCDDAFTGFERRGGRKQVNYVCMAEYDATMPNCEVAYPPVELKNVLGQYLSENGKTQLRIAETEKYAHVTFFFNGGVEAPYEGEDRCVIPSPKVAPYDLKPEMSAPEVADECVKRIESGKYDVVILNFANCDMVGHTGVFDAAVKAVEAVDTAVDQVVSAVLKAGGCAFITADHGNAEKMMNPDGTPFTAHTTNVVPFVAVGCGDVKLREGGCLADIAPTMLPYIGLPVPAEMTGKSIIVE